MKSIEIPCMMCGTMHVESAENKRFYMCEECRIKMKKVKQLQMLDNAISLLKKGGTSPYWSKTKHNGYYDEQYMSLFKNILDNTIFDSKYEIIMAIIFEKNNVLYELHKRFGKRIVDFALPDLKIIVEVDGILYHQNESEEFLREREIMRACGEDWEIIRIPEIDIPMFVVEDIENALLYVLSQREEQKRFRDTRSDSEFLREFAQMQRYLKGDNHGQKAAAIRKIWN